MKSTALFITFALLGFALFGCTGSAQTNANTTGTNGNVQAGGPNAGQYAGQIGTFKCVSQDSLSTETRYIQGYNYLIESRLQGAFSIAYIMKAEGTFYYNGKPDKNGKLCRWLSVPWAAPGASPSETSANWQAKVKDELNELDASYTCAYMPENPNMWDASNGSCQFLGLPTE